ncbi:MAG TPA: hypothetical protein VF559_00810 [Caulobacteraceae bacterium]|jgi:hypothetical protein
MGTLSGPWAGQLYGDEPGQLYAELSGSGAGVSGVLSIHRTSGDIEILNCSGAFADGRLELACSPASPSEPESRLRGVIAAEGHLSGEWLGADGRGAEFVLFPHQGGDSKE